MSSAIQVSEQLSYTLEPRLSDVLNDPVIHAVMARDGVTEAELRSVICRAQKGLRVRARR